MTYRHWNEGNVHFFVRSLLSPIQLYLARRRRDRSYRVHLNRLLNEILLERQRDDCDCKWSSEFVQAIVTASEASRR